MLEQRCPQCGNHIAAEGQIRCPRCNKLLLQPCGGSCSRCKEQSRCAQPLSERMEQQGNRK